MSFEKCPFCDEPQVRSTLTGCTFRCGTHGPDINGEYATGHTCDITTWSRVLKAKDAENEQLTAERDDAIAMARDLSADLFDAQKQRADAREAARWMYFRLGWMADQKQAMLAWPWLEPTRTDRAGRDVTDTPGLWDESDAITEEEET